MEQLIIFAIIAIASSLFAKFNNNKEQQSMPPFDKTVRSPSSAPLDVEEPTHHHRPTAKKQSFEDFAREFLGELTAEMSTANDRKERMKPVQEKVKEHTPSYVAPPLIPTEPSGRKTERLSLDRMAAGQKDSSVVRNNGFQLPNSQKALVQAVVMAEILGSPKAKRK